MRKGICIVTVLALTATVLGGPRAGAGREKLSPKPVNDVAVLQAQGIRTLAQAETDEGTAGVQITYPGRNVAADPTLAEAYLYKNDSDSGYGVFLNYEPQTGAYYPGTMTADETILGNGFVAGTPVTRFAILVFRSTGDPTCDDQLAEYTVELWSGDPFDAVETDTAPHSVLASCTFTGYPCGVWWLDSADPTAVCTGLPAFPTDPRVWITLSGNYNCRTGWRISYLVPEVGSIYTGTADVFETQDDELATAGTCCDADDDPTVCTVPGGPFCAGDATGSRLYCSDNFAESAGLYYFGGPCAGLSTDSCASFVANVYTQTNTIMGVFPISSDSAGAVIDFNTITLGAESCDNRKITMEMKIHGWDHDLSGLPTLKTWEIDIDDAAYGFTNSGTLAYESVPCATSNDCVTAWGGVCSLTGGACTIPGPACPLSPIESCKGSSCDYPTGVGGFCAPGFQFGGRTDGLLLKELPACDVSTPDFRCGSTLSPSGVCLADNGSYWYGATLKYVTTSPVSGVAEVITLPASFMKDCDNNAIPLVGVVNAVVICPTGQCCDLSVQPFVCLADDVTKDECDALGGVWTVGKTCDDPCGCQTDAQCKDGDACTVDRCVANACVNTPITVGATNCCDNVPLNENADINGLGAITDYADPDPCTVDFCDPGAGCALGTHCGVAAHDPADGETACNDDNQCTYDDQCDGHGAGSCAGLDVNGVACLTPADCLAETGVEFGCVDGFCLCVLSPDITPVKVDPPPFNCYEAGSTVEVDIFVGAAAGVINGAQFTLFWDPTCLQFVSIAPGGAPYVFEIMELLGVYGPGSVFYAVGVDPFGGVGVNGNAVLATVKFTKIGVCNECIITIGGNNPYDAMLTDDEGQPITVIPQPSKPIYDLDTVTMDVPGDVVTNVDCNHNTAIETWDGPTADSDCANVALDCTGEYPDGSAIPLNKILHGGEFPLGVSEMCCTAVSVACGGVATDCWTVTVVEQTALDITVQLSPIIAGADFTRCIEFELFANCIEEPIDFAATLEFGGMWDYIGHYTDTVKIPEIGQWYCVTARDQLHTLRSTAFLDCVDGVYEASFKGDPFWGGNWLIGGNLDGYKKSNPNASHNVIDILDFGQFVAHYLDVIGASTDCLSEYPNGHADINGDGVVNALDFSFIMMNFLEHSKDACCPDAAATVYTARTEVSVRELRQMGMGELSVADLNNDGLVNVDDMNAFMAGGVKAPARITR